MLAKAQSLDGVEAALAAAPEIGPPDYTDEGMLQYLRTQRIIPPYQTRGYKLVEMVRVYEAGRRPARPAASAERPEPNGRMGSGRQMIGAGASPFDVSMHQEN